MSCLWNSYRKALQNPKWSFMRSLSDTGDTLLGIFMFWFSVHPPRVEFTVKGSSASLFKEILPVYFLPKKKTNKQKNKNSTDERWDTLPVICRFQWTEAQLIVYWKRDALCKHGYGDLFCQIWRWFLITMAFSELSGAW